MYLFFDIYRGGCPPSALIIKEGVLCPLSFLVFIEWGALHPLFLDIYRGGVPPLFLDIYRGGCSAPPLS